MRSYLTLSKARIFLRTLANLSMPSEDKRVTIDRFSHDVTTFLSEILTAIEDEGRWRGSKTRISSFFDI